MTSSPDDEVLLALALEVAYEAGRLLVEERPDVVSADVKSSPTDMVTEMDRASEALLVERIAAARPHDGILGEEGGERRGTSGVRWILDPVDGTTNYLYGLPAWAVSVGVERAGVVVAGVVEAPALGRRYLAVRGGGAWEEDGRARRSLRVSTCESLALALISTGFGYSAKRRAEQAEDLRHLAPRVRDIRRMGSAALDLAWVGAGYVDGYFETGLHPWDVAAGSLIVEEAGGRFYAVPGSPEAGDLTIAVSPGIAEELVTALTASGLNSIEST